MAHPFAKHAEQAHGKERAKHITKGYKSGGKVHSDEAEDRKLFNKMMKQHEKGEMKVEGKASGGRLDTFARGGRAKGKGKGHNTKININIAPRGPHPADGAAPPIPLGPPPMGGGPLPPPGGPPPGGLPPGLAGPPPGLGGPKPPGMMARGGGIKMKGGAETGQGRLDKVKAYKARG